MTRRMKLVSTHDYRYRCPCDGCPYSAAVVGTAWSHWHRRYRLRCAAGHRLTVDLLPREVA